MGEKIVNEREIFKIARQLPSPEVRKHICARYAARIQRWSAA